MKFMEGSNYQKLSLKNVNISIDWRPVCVNAIERLQIYHEALALADLPRHQSRSFNS